MEITNKTTTIITASEGKILRRKSDGTIYGKTVYLGYNYYESGQLLNEPHLDTPEDFEEIEEPQDEFNASEETTEELIE